MATQTQLLSVLIAVEFVAMGAIVLILDFWAALPAVPLFLLFLIALYSYFS